MMGAAGTMRQAQDAALTPAGDTLRDVEERRLQQIAAGDDPDPARLLHYEKPRISGRCREMDRVIEASFDLDQFEGRIIFRHTGLAARRDFTFRSAAPASR